MTITDDQIRALREHFAEGPPISSGVTADRSSTPRSISLNVIKFSVPEQEGAPVIATDGSSQNSDAALQVIAGAAVASDGRMEIGWYETRFDIRASLYAEWQAARLGLRLAARYPDGVTLVSDQATVSEQIRRAITGRPLHGVITSGVDHATTAEILTLTRGRKIDAVCRSGTDRSHRTAMARLGRTAHVGAWLTQRLAADGFDPHEHASWIAEVVARPTGDKKTLRVRYLRYAKRQGLTSPTRAR